MNKIEVEDLALRGRALEKISSASYHLRRIKHVLTKSKTVTIP